MINELAIIAYIKAILVVTLVFFFGTVKDTASNKYLKSTLIRKGVFHMQEEGKWAYSLLCILVLSVLLSGCATPYQRKGLTGGYSDTRIQDGIYLVGFQGNAFINEDTVLKYANRRAEEVCKANGYSSYDIIEGPKFYFEPNPSVRMVVKCKGS